MDEKIEYKSTIIEFELIIKTRLYVKIRSGLVIFEGSGGCCKNNSRWGISDWKYCTISFGELVKRIIGCTKFNSY